MDLTRAIILSEIAEAAGCDLADVTDESTLLQLGVTSLYALELVFNIEEKLRRKVLGGGVVPLDTTVGELVERVKEGMRVEA